MILAEKADSAKKERVGVTMSEGRKCCQHKTKERPEAEYKDLIHRLNRIEGLKQDV